jgi:hypothetical protein
MKNGCVSGYHIFYMSCIIERAVCGIWDLEILRKGEELEL